MAQQSFLFLFIEKYLILGENIGKMYYIIFETEKIN